MWNVFPFGSARWLSLFFGGFAKLSKAMTIKDVMEKTGYSRSQLQRRLDLLRPVLNGALRKGPKNALQLGEEAVQLLIKLRDLEGQGFRPVDAVARVISEIGEKQDKAPKNTEPKNEKQAWNRMEILLLLVAVLLGILAVEGALLIAALWR